MRSAILISGQTFPKDPDLPPLRCPNQDVDDMQRVLQNEKHWPYRCLTFKDADSTDVLSAIYQELQNRENELVLVYFSGHGKLDRANRLYLCTANTQTRLLPVTSVPAESVRQFLDDSPVRQLVLILDCCFAGAVTGAFRKKSTAEDETSVALTQAFEGRGIYLLTSSTRNQTSREKEGDRNSVFTGHLLEQIENGNGDLNEDGYLTMDEVYAYVFEKMRMDPEQLPTRSDFGALGLTQLAKTGRRSSEDPARVLRKRLLVMYESDALPSSIAFQAAELVLRDPATLPATEQELRHLVAQFLTGKQITSDQFIQEWSRRTLSGVQALLPSATQQSSPEDADSCFKEGERYYYGQNAARDIRKAQGLFERAAVLGSADGMYRLGLLFENGEGVEKDYTRAKRHYEGAAAWGSSMAMRRLGALYRLGHGVTQDHGAAVKWYEQAAALGNAEAYRVLGTIYKNGDGVAQDYRRALSYFEQSAALGDATAFTSMAILFEEGLGTKKDPDKARQCYEKAAERNDPEALHWLGHAYERRGEEWYPKAAESYKQAALGANIEAHSDLARMYEHGRGVPQDGAKALDWCQKGIDLGCSKAMVVMGLFYHDGNIVAKDDEKAFDWLAKAAQADSPNGAQVLGVFYQHGIGVKRSLPLARQWYERAASLGWTDAMVCLSDLILELGGKDARQEAQKWLEKAVTRRSPKAMYKLANMVAYDKPRSTALMKMAAEAGSKDAAAIMARRPPSLLDRLKRLT